MPAQGNTVVSQGKLTVSGDTSYFTNSRKLQGITLISGQFYRDSFRLAGNPLLFEFYGTKKSMLGSAWGDYPPRSESEFEAYIYRASVG